MHFSFIWTVRDRHPIVDQTLSLDKKTKLGLGLLCHLIVVYPWIGLTSLSLSFFCKMGLIIAN